MGAILELVLGLILHTTANWLDERQDERWVRCLLWTLITIASLAAVTSLVVWWF